MKDSIPKDFKEVIDELIGSYTSKCQMKDKFSSLIKKDHRNCIIKPSYENIKSEYLKKKFDYFNETAIKLINNDRFILFITSFTRIFWLARLKFNIDTEYESIINYKATRNLIVKNLYNFLYYWSAYSLLKRNKGLFGKNSDIIRKNIDSPIFIDTLIEMILEKIPGFNIALSFRKAILLILDDFDLPRYWFRPIATLIATGKLFLPLPEDILGIDIDFGRNNNPNITINVSRDLTLRDITKNWNIVKTIRNNYYPKRKIKKKRNIEKEIIAFKEIANGKNFPQAYFDIENTKGFDEEELKYENLYENFKKRYQRLKLELDPKNIPIKRKKKLGSEVLDQLYDGDIKKLN